MSEHKRRALDQLNHSANNFAKANKHATARLLLAIHNMIVYGGTYEPQVRGALDDVIKGEVYSHD